MKKAIVDILLYLFTIFIGAIVFSIIGAVLNNAINPGSGMDSVMDNPWLMGTILLGTQLPVILFFLAFRRANYSFGNLDKVNTIGTFSIYAFIMMVGAILIEQFILSVIPSEEQMFSYLEMFKPLMYNPLCVLLICIGAPLTEELVFRGAIQGHLMKWTKNPWVAIILASILFGLAHGNLPQFIAGFILGMVCGWLFYRTGSIWPGIILHFINNTFSTVSTWIWGMEDSEMTGNILPNLILPIVGIILIYIAYKKLVPVTEDSVMKNEEPSEASVIEEKKEEEVIL
jgi:membrane protease YdiL (CAAX protease family)